MGRGRILTGLHRSPRKGFSVEFAEHRPYQPGDDLRYLDWKIAARADRWVVKQFEEETNLRAAARARREPLDGVARGARPAHEARVRRAAGRRARPAAAPPARRRGPGVLRRARPQRAPAAGADDAMAAARGRARAGARRWGAGARRSDAGDALLHAARWCGARADRAHLRSARRTWSRWIGRSARSAPPATM